MLGALTRRVLLGALIVLSVLTVSCVYFLRSNYILTPAQTPLTVGDWTITPQIRSAQLQHQGRIPDPPDSFVISFRASRPISRKSPERMIENVSLDSVRIIFDPQNDSGTYIFNECAFISAPSDSPDSIMKRFSVIDQNSHRLIWHRFPAQTGALLLFIYATSDSGICILPAEAAPRTTLDSIQSSGRPGNHLVLTTMVTRHDRVTTGLGISED